MKIVIEKNTPKIKGLPKGNARKDDQTSMVNGHEFEEIFMVL